MTAHTQIWTTGPAPIATGTGASGAMEFLGFSENGFTVRESAFFRPIHDDARGPEMAADQMALGKAVVISGQVITYDMAVLGRVKARYLVSGGSPGAIVAGELGALLKLEGLTMNVMIKFPYASKSQMSGMDSGIRIIGGYVMGDIGTPTGVKAMTVNLTFAAIINFNTTNNTGTLFDNDVSGFPAYT